MTFKWFSEFLRKAVIFYIPLSFLTPILLYQLRDNNRLIIMDASNSYHISEYSSSEETRSMYDFIARQAITAFLMRNPIGVDNPDLFDSLYRGKAKLKAMEFIKAESKQFLDYRMHQKAEILTVKVLQADKKRSFVEISGQLLRVFFMDDEKVTLAAEFKASMELTVNFELANSARFPFLVTALNYHQTEMKEKKGEKSI